MQYQTFFLKNTASKSAKILEIIFKQSLQTGCLPKDWRDANVSPIFKKRDRHQTQNYRPVSLTSISCKILEHIIVKHILNHFDMHKILTKFQHGFRSELSCETQLLETTNDFLSSLALGNRSTLLYWTFPKPPTPSPIVDCWKAKSPWHKGGYSRLDHPVSQEQNPESSSRWGELRAGACSLRCAAGYRSGPTSLPVLYK